MNIELYNYYIYERYTDLKRSGKESYDLSKIFEYYSCIKLTEEYGKNMVCYDDLFPNF